jgi:hypothetical protein
MTPKAPLHFIGDSHTDYLRDAAIYGFFADRKISKCVVGGATAVGLRNPKSTTDALTILKRSLVELDRSTIVILQLGEVDCGFVIWYRAQKYGETVDDQLSQSVAAYRAFVQTIQAQGFRRVIITGAMLPTIPDGHQWGDVADLRREVAAPIAARTALTLRYNEALRKIARELGTGYTDITEILMDSVTGTIHGRFRHPNLENHHIHPVFGARAWGAQLTPELEKFDLAQPRAIAAGW